MVGTQAKTCLIAWWVAAIISFLLWYRNYTYDRIIAAVVFILGLIQLVQYGCYSLMNPIVAGRITAVLIYLLVIVLLIGVLIYTGATTLIIVTAVICFMLGLLLFDLYFRYRDFRTYTPSVESGADPDAPPVSTYTGNGVQWLQADGGPMFNTLEITLFIVAVVVAWLYLMSYFNWKDVGLYLIAIYIIVVAIYAEALSQEKIEHSGSRTVQYLIGIVLIVWLAGVFKIQECK